MRRAAPLWGAGGFSLIELLVALTTSVLLLGVLSALMVAQARATRIHIERGRVAEALRVSALVAGAELALLEPSADADFLSESAVSLRAFRGVAVPCGGSEGELIVRYRGMRRPEPEKDSVVWVSARAPERPLALAWSAGAEDVSCRADPSDDVLRWWLSEPHPSSGLLLLYERGSYHLEGGAFRYRRGAAGRQPLTESLLVERASALHALETAAPDGPSAVEIVLVAEAEGDPAVRGTARVRVAFLNARPR